MSAAMSVPGVVMFVLVMFVPVMFVVAVVVFGGGGVVFPVVVIISCTSATQRGRGVHVAGIYKIYK